MKAKGRVSIAGAVLLCALAMGATAGGSKPKLVLQYTMDHDKGDVVSDSSRAHHDGTAHGAEWVKVHGKNKALSFDGIDDYVDMGPSSQFVSHGELTVSLWVNLERDWAYFVSNYHGGLSYAGQFFFAYDSEQHFYVGMGQAWDVGVAYYSTEADLLTLGEWHHVAFTYKESRGDGKKVQMYLDGEPVDCFGIKEGNGGEILGTDEALLLMACQDPWAPGYAPGMMDEVMIWTLALTANQVGAVYMRDRKVYQK